MDPKLREILDDTKGRTVTVLSCLINIQDHVGYLPPDSMAAVAEYTGASVNDIHGVATFYSHFRFEPEGEHTIELCWGPSCQLFDSKGLMAQAEEFAGIKFNGTTEDHRYTLRGLECAGACALAPVGKVDGKLAGRLTKERLKGMLEQLNGKRQGGQRG